MPEVNLPNVLTVIRILLVPVLVAALLADTRNGDILAAVVFAVASVTDFVDGYLARSPEHDHNIRQADGSDRRQTACHLGVVRACLT